MFTIKNRDSVRRALDIIGQRGSLLRLDLGPGQSSEPIEDGWLEYFQQNPVEWALIIPGKAATIAEPEVIRSIGKIAVETRAAKAKPQRPKKRSK